MVGVSTKWHVYHFIQTLNAEYSIILMKGRLSAKKARRKTKTEKTTILNVVLMKQTGVAKFYPRRSRKENFRKGLEKWGSRKILSTHITAYAAQNWIMINRSGWTVKDSKARIFEWYTCRYLIGYLRNNLDIGTYNLYMLYLNLFISFLFINSTIFTCLGCNLQTLLFSASKAENVYP